MHVTRTIDYPADLERVHTMLTSREFTERKCADSGAPSYRVRVGDRPAEGAGTMIVVDTERTVPTADLPSFVRGAVGDTLTIEEHYEWPPLQGRATSTTADVQLRVAGAPVSLRGRLELRSVGPDRTQARLEADLKAAVPLMGKRIEQALAPFLQSQLDAEERVGREWLAQH